MRLMERGKREEERENRREEKGMGFVERERGKWRGRGEKER